MFNPNTLSEMAEQKRQHIHRHESLRRLAKKQESVTQPFQSNIVQYVVRFVQRQVAQLQQAPSALRPLEDVKSKR